MSNNEAALALHRARTTLLAHHPHKETVSQSLHKLGGQASAIIHGPDHQGLLTLAFIVMVIAALYGLWQFRSSSK
jgi:hypothetical protein